MSVALEQTVIDRTNIGPQLDAFFGGMDAAELERIGELTEQLHHNGNAAFNTELPADGIEHVPTLLDSEDVSVLCRRLITQYTHRKDRPAIIVAGNAGEESVDEERYQTNLHKLRDFGRLCVARCLPFSFYETTYPGGTPIGRIRADMHASGLDYFKQQACRHRVRPHDLLLLGSDADFIAVDPDYYPSIIDRLKQSDKPGLIAGPRVTHDRLDAARFPRINQLLDLYDLKAFFDVGIAPWLYAVNAGAYGAVGGFDPECSVAELRELRKRMQGELGEDAVRFEVMPHFGQTSARHLIHNILAGQTVEYGHLQTAQADGTDYRRGGEPAADVTAEHFQTVFRAEMHRMLRTLYYGHLKAYHDEGNTWAESYKLAKENIRIAMDIVFDQLPDIDDSYEIMLGELKTLMLDIKALAEEMLQLLSQSAGSAKS